MYYYLVFCSVICTLLAGQRYDDSSVYSTATSESQFPNQHTLLGDPAAPRVLSIRSAF